MVDAVEEELATRCDGELSVPATAWASCRRSVDGMRAANAIKTSPPLFLLAAHAKTAPVLLWIDAQTDCVGISMGFDPLVVLRQCCGRPFVRDAGVQDSVLSGAGHELMGARIWGV